MYGSLTLSFDPVIALDSNTIPHIKNKFAIKFRLLNKTLMIRIYLTLVISINNIAKLLDHFNGKLKITLHEP